MKPALLSVVLLIGFAAVAGAAPVRVDRSDAAGVSFTWAPGPMTRTEVGAGDDAAWRIEFEGAPPAGEPGEPLLPVRTERILLPLDGDYRIDFFTSGEHRIEGARLLVATPSGDAPRNGFAPSVVSSSVDVFRGRRLLVVTMRPALYDPETRVLTTFDRIDVRVDFDRSSRAAGTSGLRPDPVFDPVWSGVLNPPERDAAGRLAVRPVLAAKPGSRADLPTDYFDDASDWIKVRVRQNGLYRITGSDLAGLVPGTIDPATIRMFAGLEMALSETTPESAVPAWGSPGGFREIAIRVTESGTPDGVFSGADALLFYGLGPDNFRSWYDPQLPEEWYEDPTTNDNVYWVTWGGSFSGPPRRMAELSGGGGVDVSVVQDKAHFEKNDPTLFDPLPEIDGVRWEKWWWQRIEDSGSSYFWDLALDHPDTTKQATLFARWWGSTWPNAVPDDPGRNHYLTVNVNGGPDKSAVWGGSIRTARYDMTIDDVVPRSTTRVIATVLKLPSPPNITRIDQVLLAWFEVTYWKTLDLSSKGLWWDGRSAGSGPVTFRVANAGAGAAVYDVTEPWNTAIVPTTLSGTTLSAPVAAPAGRRWFAVATEGIVKPAGLEIDERPARLLRDPRNEADYIVIAYDDFIGAAKEIALWRRTHLRGITDLTPAGVEPRDARTLAVRASDIYDEFSGGRVDPTAIRNFLQYASSQWANAADDPVSYVFLLGDANRDTRNYEESNIPNYLPSWQNGFDYINDSTNPQYSSDDFFGRLEGPNDRLTDLVIGRMPVTSAEEALTLVRNKIIPSETIDAVNPNRARAILVADDVCQGGHLDILGVSHIQQTESVAANIPPEFDVKKIELYDYGQDDCSLLYKPTAKRDLIVAMNEGGWLVNYIGHGGDQQMADEKVLEVPDVPSLDDLGSLPVLVAASCSVGKFDRSGSDGLAEVLVRARNGGCIATFAATHLSYASENGGLNNRIMGALFPRGDNRSVTVGLALLQAKTAQVMAGGGGDRQKKYLTLGDPASILPCPTRRIRFAAAPDTLFRGTAATVSGDVLDEFGEPDPHYNGTLDLKVFDQAETRVATGIGGSTTYTIPGATLFTGRTQVTDGRFSATFIVPVSLRGGPAGRIRAYTSGATSTGGSGIAATVRGVEALGALDPVPIVGTAPVGADTTAPEIVLSLPGAAVPGAPLNATIKDASGINLTRLFEFRSVLFTVLDDTEAERFRADVTDRFEYDNGSYQSGALHTTVPELPAGHYTFRITATDNFNNRGAGNLSVTLAGAAGTSGISSVYGLPNPFNDKMEITWMLDQNASVRASIFSVSGRKVREWSVDGISGENRLKWDGRDQKGDAVANGVYLLRLVAHPLDGGKSTDIVEPLVRIR